MRILKDVGVVMVAAALVAAGAGLALRPEVAGADGEPAVTRVVAGAEVEVRLDRETYEAGAEPVLTLVATNRGEKEISGTVEVRLLSRNVDLVARSLPIPIVAWRREITLALKPGETKKLVLETKTATAEGLEYQADVGAPGAPVTTALPPFRPPTSTTPVKLDGEAADALRAAAGPSPVRVEEAGEGDGARAGPAARQQQVRPRGAKGADAEPEPRGED